MTVKESAKLLGEAVAASEEVKGYLAAKEAYDTSRELQEMLGEYSAQRMLLGEERMKPLADQDGEMLAKLEARVDGLEIRVHRIVNNFFGESVTVAGLLTGQDALNQLKDKPLGDELIYPAVMCRADEEIFLDDMTPAELSKKLGNNPLRPCVSDGADLIKALLGV